MNIQTLKLFQNEFLTKSKSTKYLYQQFRRINTINKVSTPKLQRQICGYLSRPVILKNSPTTKHVLCLSQSLHTSSCVWSQNDNNKQVKVNATIVNLQNPFKFIALKIKLFLLKSYFDKSFTEDDFIKGAKQAVCYVSGKISEGNFTDLDYVLTPEGLHSGRQLYHQNLSNTSSIRVDEGDVLNISMSDIGFEYGEEGRKWAYVLVVCFCKAKESVAKTFGNIDVIATPTRLLRYSFRREYTPGTNGGWFVDKIEQLGVPFTPST